MIWICYILQEDENLLIIFFLFFQEDENFPHGLYSDSALIAVLREIGLRGPQEVQVEDLLESVHVIQDMVDGGKQVWLLIFFFFFFINLF